MNESNELTNAIPSDLDFLGLRLGLTQIELDAPQDECMITTIGMVMAYRRCRAWLRNMERLGRQNGHSEMADLIAEGMLEWDADIDAQCMFGDTL